MSSIINATAPNVLSATVLRANAVSLTTTVQASVTGNILLTPGDWMIWGYIGFTGTSAAITRLTAYFSGNNPDNGSTIILGNVSTIATWDFLTGMPVIRQVVTVNTNVFLGAVANFGSGSVGAYGGISARQMA